MIKNLWEKVISPPGPKHIPHSNESLRKWTTVASKIRDPILAQMMVRRFTFNTGDAGYIPQPLLAQVLIDWYMDQDVIDQEGIAREEAIHRHLKAKLIILSESRKGFRNNA